MKYSQHIIFESWNEVNDFIANPLKTLGVKEGGSIVKDSETINVQILGKITPNVKSLIDLKGTSMSDYESIDDETKKVCYAFPMDNCSKLLEYLFGFEGRFLEIPSKNQDPTSTEINKDIMYISETQTDNMLNEQVSERIETVVNIVDFENDDKEYITEMVLEAFGNIAKDIGNKNLSQEINSLL